ncbi:carbohydrate kinase [Pantoea agglomerans]|uniref:glycine-rich domain-containing protein n=1 Tax=Enterobacter agglomerans TaxID=549 RepID=UPI00100960E1|nr:carbohydrate kinase [Pantoea agglomerans]QAV45379.1 carbohydrate kinase [Pantoea agglomerans]QAV50219.1 carbohydrate kinase [Pantoea agglomerans]
MHRIDTSTAQVDKFGAGKNGFTGGNPQTGELPTALDADFFDAVQEEIARVIEAAGLTLNKTNKAQLLAAMNTLVGPGRLLNVQLFTASGTYTPTPGTKSIVVEVQGAGGGAGGIGGAGTGTVAIGNGGAAGGYAKSRLTSGFSGGISITVGTGGPGGNLAPTNGTDGGLSSFGSTIIANGGAGGLGQNQTTPPYSVTGSLGGIATGGNIVNMRGGASANGAALSTGSVLPGIGGAAMLGLPVLSPANNGAPIYAAFGYGAGGGGSYAFNRAGFSGGSGANGVVIIWEYA